MFYFSNIINGNHQMKLKFFEELGPSRRGKLVLIHRGLRFFSFKCAYYFLLHMFFISWCTRLDLEINSLACDTFSMINYQLLGVNNFNKYSLALTGNQLAVLDIGRRTRSTRQVLYFFDCLRFGNSLAVLDISRRTGRAGMFSSVFTW